MIVGHNFKSSLLYHCDTQRDCKSYGCDEICRCSTITNARVVVVNFTSLVSSIMDIYFKNSKSTSRNFKINTIIGGVNRDVEFYTIDRILRINRVYRPECWEIQITAGYYGQEIDDIILKPDIALNIESQLLTAFEIVNLKLRVEYLLNLEYGYIIDDLKNKDYFISEIPFDSIEVGSDYQKTLASRNYLSHYSDSNYNSFRAIVIQKDDKFRLIDGYHRCSSTENKSVKVIVAK